MDIHWVHPEQFDDRQREIAVERLQALAQGQSDLLDVRIMARTNEHHRHGGQEVRITCDAGGKELVAARARADAGLSLDEALDAFERQVWRMRHRRTQRRSERPAEPPELGVIDEIRRDEGYGFILTDAGERVYFHRNAVGGGLDFETLEEGACVGLDFEAGRDGPQARFVAIAPPHRRGA
jgi:cold shock CspA family protein/ribosome-associated translation inhibitor RaiA